MKATKITHRNELRIKVDFPYNSDIALRLKQISGARWSKTMGAWHIPYTKEAFVQLKELFSDVDYNHGQVAASITPPLKVIAKPKHEIEPPAPTSSVPVADVVSPSVTSDRNKNSISIEITSKNIFVRIPKNEVDIQYIRSYKFAQWDTRNFCWVVPNFKDNADKIKAYFQLRTPTITEYLPALENVNNTSSTFSKNEMLVVNNLRTLKVYFSYSKDVLADIKKIPYSAWHAEGHCWTVPASEKFISELKVIARQNSLAFVYREETKLQVKPRTSRHDIENYRHCPPAYIAKLKELRYSQNTLETYKHMFEEFINHFPQTEIDDITDTMIVDFLRYLVNERNISGSYQNQSINSIKFYYERVMGGQRKIYTIDRPRKERILPEVLSQEEIIMIINATENLKHKAILMTIYSAGLRISELINLRIKDIDSNRMQIRVVQAKGKKDRYTLLSTKTLEVLRKYFLEYKPTEWIFEGTKGEQYARRSIQEILKKSVDKVGIMKRITVHTLRHSFATHLLESGTDIRYIQSLLGHSSGKTTEIYTHITTKGFDQIKSPLDNLKIK